MGRVRAILAIAVADFRERVRRTSYLFTLAFTLYLGYLVFIGKIRLTLENFRGEMNSAWLGWMMSAVVSTFLSIVGFYIVKNTVARDEETRVGRILAATRLSRREYMAGKLLSNTAVLSTMLLVLVVVAAVMQVLKGEQRHIDLVQLTTPFIMVGFPAMVLTAALAVFFEAVPMLRRGLGNIVYFFTWSFLVTATFEMKRFPDLFGISMIQNEMWAVIARDHPGVKRGITFGLDIGPSKATEIFVWNGVEWTARLISERVMIVMIAVAITGVAALLFDRFDPAAWGWFKKNSAAKAVQEKQGTQNLWAAIESAAHLSPVRFGGAGLQDILASELRIMLRGTSRWWFVVAGGVAVACAVTRPLKAAMEIPYVLAAIVPMLMWSQMGTREKSNRTEALIYSGPGTLTRQFPAAWLSGVLVGMAVSSPIAIRMLIARDFAGVMCWIIGMTFIPSLALAMGTVSGGTRLFEAVYVAFWYIGPLHHTPGLDFLGSTTASRMPGLYAALSIGCLAIAFWARARTIRCGALANG